MEVFQAMRLLPKEVSPASAFLPLVNHVNPASAFQGHFGIAGHRLFQHCPALVKCCTVCAKTDFRPYLKRPKFEIWP
jgi:hypothetical protein